MAIGRVSTSTGKIGNVGSSVGTGAISGLMMTGGNPIGAVIGGLVGGIASIFTISNQSDIERNKEEALNKQYDLHVQGLAIKYNTTVEDINNNAERTALTMAQQYSHSGFSTTGSSLPKLLLTNLQRSIVQQRAYEAYLQGVDQEAFTRDYGLLETSMEINKANIDQINSNLNTLERLSYTYYKGGISKENSSTEQK